MRDGGDWEGGRGSETGTPVTEPGDYMRIYHACIVYRYMYCSVCIRPLQHRHHRFFNIHPLPHPHTGPVNLV